MAYLCPCPVEVNRQLRKTAFITLAIVAIFGLVYEVSRTLFLPVNLAMSPPQRQVYDEKTIQELRQRLVTTAERYLGVPYRFGGSDEDNGFDCSGLAKTVYASVGFNLPHGANAQFRDLYKVEKPQAGDLVFFRREGPGIGHVGILVEDELFVHAPSTGKKVSYARISEPYFKVRYVGAASIFP